MIFFVENNVWFRAVSRVNCYNLRGLRDLKERTGEDGLLDNWQKSISFFGKYLLLSLSRSNNSNVLENRRRDRKMYRNEMKLIERLEKDYKKFKED